MRLRLMRGTIKADGGRREDEGDGYIAGSNAAGAAAEETAARAAAGLECTAAEGAAASASTEGAAATADGRGSGSSIDRRCSSSSRKDIGRKESDESRILPWSLTPLQGQNKPHEWACRRIKMSLFRITVTR